MMKKILLLFLLLFTLNGMSQDNLSYSDSIKVDNLEKDRKEARRDGIFKLSVGLFTHGLSFFQLKEGIKDPMNLTPFALYSGAGLAFDILAILKFSKSRKIKKEIELIKENSDSNDESNIDYN